MSWGSLALSMRAVRGFLGLLQIILLVWGYQFNLSKMNVHFSQHPGDVLLQEMESWFFVPTLALDKKKRSEKFWRTGLGIAYR